RGVVLRLCSHLHKCAVSCGSLIRIQVHYIRITDPFVKAIYAS
ncbi:hypothetical protein P3T25_009949, partial [Paraburkholderia sp. GAS32]